jgi:hypothetical protein
MCKRVTKVTSTTMTDNRNVICSGLPMSLDQVQDYLQGYHGIPIVLRKEGTTSIKCCYCLENHDHMGPPGRYIASCDDRNNGSGIVIGERHFIPNYGYKLYDFKERDDVNELLVPDDEVIRK